MDHILYKKRFILFIILIFFIINNTSIGKLVTIDNQKSLNYERNIFYVGGQNPGNFSNIQEAIDQASTGDTIYVYNGTYIQNIFINFTLNLIGEDKNTTFIDGGSQNDVIYIGFPADAVTITGFTIQNSGNNSEGGAIFDAGLEIHSDYNNIINNIIKQHPLYGIVLWASKGDNISYNKITNCERSGIYFLAGPSNTISHNIISSNEVGISSLGSTNCKENFISHNTFINNNKGLAMCGSNNQIFNNNFINNIDFNAMSHFDFLKFKPSRNTWYQNYWDKWIGFGPKWVPGFLGFNFDWYPAHQPYPYQEGEK